MKNLKILRFLKGMSQQDLADALRCSKTKVSALEQCERDADLETIAKCAEIFDIDPGVLTGDMCLLAVPSSWHDIYTDARKREIINAMNSHGTKMLTRIFHEVIEAFQKAADRRKQVLQTT